MSNTHEVTADQLRDVVTRAQVEFRERIRAPLDAITKADGSIVTRVDAALDQWLRPTLALLDPEAAWLSEETVDDSSRLNALRTWIVDPLDGTKELARGVPECAISIGLVCDGAPVAGAVMNPFDGTGAAAGTDGSWLAWGERLPAYDAAAPTVVSVSRSESEDGSIAPYLDLIAPSHPVGSVANKLLRVAVRLERMTVSVQPKSEWDLCGGVALLHARGMTLARLDGLALEFNRKDARIRSGFVAGTPDEVRATLGAVRARHAERALHGATA